MMTKENGVTLVALVMTIILLLILVSIGGTLGIGTVKMASFTQFKKELEVIQDKVNEYNQYNQYDKLDEDESVRLLTKKEKSKCSDILKQSNVMFEEKFEKKSEAEKNEIINGFRYINKDFINKKFKLDNITREYFVNFKYRYVIFPDGYEYEGTKYYMINQIEGEIYNVEYKNKNSNTGSFKVTEEKIGDKYKINVYDINYDGYVNEWQVKYKLDGDSYWKTSNEMTFYVKEDGKYNIKVVHGDEIDLGSQNVFAFNYYNGVNSPKILQGMTPIKFTEPTDTKEGTIVTTTVSDSNWYSYDTEKKKWANAQTEDGSMWVWIPRYAYKINSSKQTCDIVFLIGTTDNYYDEEGKIQTAKRQENENEKIDTTTGYTVHPAFTDESSIGYANGGWDKELSGIWVAKFEAGYATSNGNSAPKIASSVNYSQTSVWISGYETGTGEGTASARNWIDRVYGSTTTAIKYPTFQGLAYSMNYINHNDAFSISRALTESGNIYGLSSSSTDSHLMKNSEWGAVAYLAQSKYGLKGTNIYINNVNLHSSTGAQSVYAITGCATATADADQVVTEMDTTTKRPKATNVYTWTQASGTKASTTGTIYGIYDMSGGTWERTAAIVNNGNLTTFGKSLMNSLINGKSSKYVTVYPYDSSVDKTGANSDTASEKNYEKNTRIYGDGIRETSTAGTGKTSWYTDHSCFPAVGSPFFLRGGALWDGEDAGLFYFFRGSGASAYGGGFRAALVAK